MYDVTQFSSEKIFNWKNQVTKAIKTLVEKCEQKIDC